MYRKATLVVFSVLVAASAIYALIDRKTVTTSSDKAYAAYLKGEDYSKKLYTAEAITEFERAVQLDPQFAMAYARLAWLYREMGREDEYKQAKEKAFTFIDKVKDLERIQINVGFARADKRTDDLDKYSAELLDKFPNSLEAHMFLSSKYWGEMKTDSAIIENQKILEIDPNYALAMNMLGYLYFEKGEFDKALESINQYAIMAKDQANPHDSYGEILLALGRYDEALRQFQVADSIKPNLDFVLSHMGRAYFNKGMYRDALGAHFKARELALNDLRRLDYDLAISDCYIFTEDYDQAVEFLEELTAKYPEYPSPHFRLGLIYAWTGKMDKALVEFGIVKGLAAKRQSDSAATDDSKSVMQIEVAILEGEVAAAGGDYSKAIESYDSILGSLSMSLRPFVTFRRGEIYLKARQPEKAAEVLIAGLKDNPNHPLTLITLAKAYGKLGQTNAEIEVLRRLLTVYKDADEDFPLYKKASRQLQSLQQPS